MAKYSTNQDLPEYSSLSWAWVGAILILLLFVGGLVWFPPLLTPLEGKTASSILFWGRFHPIALHLPVGAMALLTIVETLCLRRSFENRWAEAALFLCLFFAGSSAVAIILGSMLGRDGFEGGAYKMHTILGVVVGILAIAGMFARLFAMQKLMNGKASGFMLEASRFFLLVNVGVMSVGAHFGANMVHGDKYLTQHAPTGMGKSIHAFEGWLLSFVADKKDEKLAPAALAETPATDNKAPPVSTPQSVTPQSTTPQSAATADAKLVFRDVITPLFEAKCNSCHCEQKVKGKLRMDDYELLMKGGADGSNTIIAGKPDESLAIIRLMLPEDDDEHMPPSEKPQFTKEETALLRWWIQAGASATMTTTEIPAEHKPIAEALMKGEAE
jgi:hypothetical protein